MRSFADLARTHEELQELFLEHRCAVAAGDPQAALEVLHRFSVGVRAHIAFENENLLPLVESRDPEEVGRGVEIFRAEHDKLLSLLDEVHCKLLRVGRDGLTPQERVELLDGSRRLDQLLEHHDERERRGLFPVLDRIVGQEQRDAIFARCDAAHAEAGLRSARREVPVTGFQNAP